MKEILSEIILILGISVIFSFVIATLWSGGLSYLRNTKFPIRWFKAFLVVSFIGLFLRFVYL